ncbi:B12-binding domain-containing radical SAM protein [Anaeromyxobacter paludicola]|uniref:B12-binding domain-containing radical SAM protein n=1 Tax=Anaeromyxobacter paludicola TaxID=2918171 RepID=A0ABM7XDY9_9BACT|nr:B12-binding domain-containing radical SAM protein [Anaeromyxobacter paludicola]BDG10030.1 B12-binding domain-containing radical SAM protein [Anaeromyxobacter paludicola]
MATERQLPIPVHALLVHPRFSAASFWNYQATCDAVGARYPASPLGLITVAALLPARWELRLVDRNVQELRDEDLAWADVVMTGGMLPQQPDTLAIVALAAAAGKLSVVGGADVSASPAVYAAADFQVRGEAEELLGAFAADLEAGARRGTYEAKRFPDLSRSPVPRFDLLDLGKYLNIGVQFSRGCPFGCEFCNVVELNGRTPRTKGVAQVLRELDALYALGYRGHVDFVDDNLIGGRKAAKALLAALAGWLSERGHPFEFSTEASIDLADDPQLLSLLRAANFFALFVGIETPDVASLVQSHKLQNTRRDLAESVRRILAAGMFVNAGFILGFDAEGDGAAGEMIALVERASVPVCMVGLLYALPGTRLARRLEAEGRLGAGAYAVDDGDADQCTSGLNFATRRPAAAVLRDYREVLREIYAPAAYFGRVRRACRELDVSGHRVALAWRHRVRDLRAFGRIARRLGWADRSARREFWRTVADCALHNPAALKIAVSLSALYLHLGPFARSVGDRAAARIAREGDPGRPGRDRPG